MTVANDAYADLRSALNSWAAAHNSRPALGNQDGIMIHRQCQTDYAITMIALCRKYGVALVGA